MVTTRHIEAAVETSASAVLAFVAVPEQNPPHPLADLRFRALVGESDWARLPDAVCRRFSKRLSPEDAVFYRGRVVATDLSRAGRLLAFLARAIGSPLPLTDGATGPALVVVTEDVHLGGQSWTRIYTWTGRHPRTVHSGMALKVTVEDAALVFHSDHYFLALRHWRLRLPRLLEPGKMCITHRDEGSGAFSFRLALTHPLLGRLVHQLAYFLDP
jgi:Domain of unknown function (DUF4166)